MAVKVRAGSVVAVISLLLLAVVSVASNVLAVGRDPQCFTETGLCINGRFLEFWSQNGGLPQFGLPLTATALETGVDTGRRHMTQWYERNRFELHQEYAAPYDVLLGRLGAERLRQLGRSWDTEPRASGPREGCLWFKETHHNVCDYDTSARGAQAGFKSYWLAVGLADPRLDTYARSLALHGLPLTEARMETNASGDTVLTQWFERGRFEWHPENPSYAHVQLGLLGSELRPTEASLAQVRVYFRKFGNGIHPLLLPQWLPEGMIGTVMGNVGQPLSVDFRDATTNKTVRLAIAVANPPLPGPNTEQSNPPFRHGRAFYQIMDRTNPVSPRQFMWNEPGQWQTTSEVLPFVPYYLTADGLSSDEFWRVANSIDVLVP